MLSLRNPATGEIHRLNGPTSLGRGAESSLRFEHSGVSGAHARIGWDGLQWKIRDLRSRNGTLLNGAAIAEAALKRGDVLRLGPSDGPTLEVQETDEPLAYVEDPVTGARHYERDGVIDCPLGTWMDLEERGWTPQGPAVPPHLQVVEPQAEPATREARKLSEAEVHFYSDPGTDDVAIVLTWGTVRVDLGFHAYFRIVLALISLNATESGRAVSKRRLAKESGQPEEYFRVYDGRVRRRFRAAGLSQADEVICAKNGMRWTILAPSQIRRHPLAAYR